MHDELVVAKADQRVGAETPRIRVLHVEDEENVARAVARALEPHGIELVWAASLRQADHLLQSTEREPFDAALLDLVLGDGVGTTLLPLLREYGVPALVMSGHCDYWAPLLVSWGTAALPKPDLTEVAGESNVEVHCVGKGVSFAQLARSLRALVDRRRYLDQRFGEAKGLTARQVDVIACAADGLSSADTARRLRCKTSSVVEWWRRVFTKLPLAGRCRCRSRCWVRAKSFRHRNLAEASR